MFAPPVAKTLTKPAAAPAKRAFGDTEQRFAAPRGLSGGGHDPARKAARENIVPQNLRVGGSWDIGSISIYPAEPINQVRGRTTPAPHAGAARPWVMTAQPIDNATVEANDEPYGIFDANGNQIDEVPVAEAQAPEQTASQGTDMGGQNGTETDDGASSAPIGISVAQPAPAPAAPPPSTAPAVPPPSGPSAPAPVPSLVVMGPTEMWWFGGDTPASYTVSGRLSSNATTGTFAWSKSGPLSLSSATAPTPTVTTTAASASQKDAKVFLKHIDTAGVSTTVGYSLTVRSPSSMTPTGNTNNAVPRGWQSLIGYSIQDQFGTTLPRAVPINEQWTNKPPIPDFAGTNWPSSAPTEGSATVNPAGWNDNMSHTDGVPPSDIPTPAAPGSGGPLVEHFAGHWHVGHLTPPGGGVNVRNVTWRFFQDHGDHA
jgi:hypothetical protein